MGDYKIIWKQKLDCFIDTYDSESSHICVLYDGDNSYICVLTMGKAVICVYLRRRKQSY